MAGRSTAADERRIEQDRRREADAELLHVDARELAKIEKTATMTTAALVTTPAVSVMPCSTACSVGTPFSHSSRTRLRMNTW